MKMMNVKSGSNYGFLHCKMQRISLAIKAHKVIKILHQKDHALLNVNVTIEQNWHSSYSNDVVSITKQEKYKTLS